METRKSFWILPAQVLMILVVLLCLFPPAAKAGNDFVDTELRVDQQSVNQAHDYSALVAATNGPAVNSPCCFSTGWLSAFLGQYNGTVYSGQFSQVGLMTDNQGGIYWFVYAEPGVQCLRGTQAWVGGTPAAVRGCVGAYNDLVTRGNWTKVELVTYGQGFWIARVYDQNSVGHDVAKIMSTSLKIYRASVVGEEGYAAATDPFLTMSYYFWHPQYMVSGQGFHDWPATSRAGSNYLFVSPASVCPGPYGAALKLSGDARFWWDGNGGATCSANPLF